MSNESIWTRNLVNKILESRVLLPMHGKDINLRGKKDVDDLWIPGVKLSFI